ncbi:tetratricopeptide repeat protein [Cellulophaga fucicola]|uniref:Tetratricopeptide repeat-containing protein n=1 Tax=Cellulophaga fucicola TaxID=76595 RepID=A0A1K1NLX2_9FLAO|nr:tetratricopeptide repeat protein [Cellulophaga fucicola]SFW36474.1 hypothetical protein SAMN05660313_01250 [Cellulophaga fucicola]
MKTKENISQELISKLNEWHNTGNHLKVVLELKSLPETSNSYLLTNLLARALNNLNLYEEALGLLQSVSEQGKEDRDWQFRVGYSLFYMDGREIEAIPYFEKAIELGDDYPSTYELLLEAKSFLSDDSESNETNEEEFTFVPEAYAQINLNMRLQPKYRAHIEDSLDYMLRLKKWGCVSGGGTSIGENGEPTSCDIDIDLVSYSEEMKNNLIFMAKNLEVANGSRLKYYAKDKDVNPEFNVEYPIGKLVGLGVYIDTQALEDEQIEVDTVIELYNSLINILGNNGALTPSHSENKNQIALYFYGEREYEYLLNKITPFLKDNVVGKNCKVVQIA